MVETWQITPWGQPMETEPLEVEIQTESQEKGNNFSKKSPLNFPKKMLLSKSKEQIRN